jgi:oligosaccharide repeat unit polymerase
MGALLAAIFTLLGIYVGKKIFRMWMNHLTIYSVVMGGLVFFYELKWLPYHNISLLTWFFVIGTSFSFFLGIITIVNARSLNKCKNYERLDKSVNELPIFCDGGKTLRNAAIFFSLVGLFVALQRWYVLIHKFGNIPSILLNASFVYKMHVHGEIKEYIPILPSFVYVGVFLSAIYTAYKGKFSFLSVFPLLCIVLKELTYFGRGEMLFSIMEFFFTFFLMLNILKHDPSQKFHFSKGNAFIAITFLIVFVVVAATFVKVMRGGAKDSYRGVDETLKKLESSIVFSPSVYLYISSDVGVLNKYLELENEEAKFGENSLRIIYYALSKFDLADEPSFFQKGYHIPMWTNTGTMIRELHADYGIAGVFLVPYLLGIFITYLWYKFYKTKNIFMLAVLVYLYIIVGFSFLMIVTRLNQWFLSQILIFVTLPFLEMLAKRKANQ